MTQQAALSFPSRSSDEALQLAVDGQVDVLARRARIAVELADDAAIGVDLDAAGAGLAADLRRRSAVRCRACRCGSPAGRAADRRLSVLVTPCPPPTAARHSPARATVRPYTDNRGSRRHRAARRADREDRRLRRANSSQVRFSATGTRHELLVLRRRPSAPRVVCASVERDHLAERIQRRCDAALSSAPARSARGNCGDCWQARRRSGRGCGRAAARAAAD